MLTEPHDSEFVGPVVTDDNPPPPGGHFSWLERPDRARLRYAVWEPRNPAVVEGTIVVVPGRTEAIEKYFEVIGELLERGFGVVALDVRGQGLSTRLLGDRMKGHVAKFSDYVGDLHALIEQELKSRPGPRLILGHSLGGHIAIRYLGTYPDVMDGAIVTSPMLSIRTRPIPGFIIRLLALLSCWRGKGDDFVMGGESQDPLKETFRENVVTHDERRYQRAKNLLIAHSELALGAPTFGWLNEAVRSMSLLKSARFLRNIERRTLIVAAGDDRVVGLKAQKTFVERLPQGFGRVAVVDKAFHEVLMETDSKRTVFWEQFDRFITSLKV